MLSFPALVALGTFVLAVAVIVGAYWALVLRGEREEKTSVRKRIGTAAVPRPARLGMQRDEEQLSTIEPLDQALRKVGFLVKPLQQAIAQSGIKVTVGAVLLATGWLALLALVVVTYLTGAWWAGLLVATTVCCSERATSSGWERA